MSTKGWLSPVLHSLRHPSDPGPLWLFPHPLAWLATIAIIAVDGLWLFVSDMRIINAGKAITGVPVLLLVMVLLVSAIGGRRMVIASLMAFMIINLFGQSGRVLNYLGVGLGLPLRDAALASMDAWLGFDWLAYVKFVNGHELVRQVLRRAYEFSALPIAAMWLAATGRMERLRAFTLMFIITATTTIIIGSLLPALSAFTQYNPGPETIGNLPQDAGRKFVAHAAGFNSGEMRVIDMTRMMGIVALPSFHTIMALIAPWSLRGTLLFWPSALLAALVILATPVYGGHYMVDIIAGAAVFFATAWALRRLGLDGARDLGARHAITRGKPPPGMDRPQPAA